MSILRIFLCALALSMDAFAVAICKGLSMKKVTVGAAVTVGVWFGIFQMLMPAVGYALTSMFSDYMTGFSKWIAFILLAAIGANMVKEAFEKDEEEMDDSLAFPKMLVLAIATSIDALASGVTFAMTDTNIFIAIPAIGVITFLLSALGVKLGNVFGMRYKKIAEVVGGIVLMLLGLEILLDGYGIVIFPI